MVKAIGMATQLSDLFNCSVCAWQPWQANTATSTSWAQFGI